MQTILVTGGAGFIGSAVVRWLIANTRSQVINIDKLTYAANLQNVASVSTHPRYHFEQTDINNRTALDAIFARYQPNAVLHLAAETHVDRSINNPAAFIEANINGTYTLLEAARAWWNGLAADKKPRFRFHHVSTDEVYGDLATPDRPAFTETSPYAPSSPYSASKAAADHLVRAWHRTYGLPVVISNCSNNYGPCQYPEKLIPLVIANALAGKPLPIYGSGNHIRDWLYVDDHAEALYQVLTRGKTGETYNIGGHAEKKNIEVVQAVCVLLDELHPMQGSGKAPQQKALGVHGPRASGKDGVAHPPATQLAAPSYASLITHVADRPGHDRRYAINAGKIARELGWKPKESFESGLRKTVLWYLSTYKNNR